MNRENCTIFCYFIHCYESVSYIKFHFVEKMKYFCFLLGFYLQFKKNCLNILCEDMLKSSQPNQESKGIETNIIYSHIHPAVQHTWLSSSQFFKILSQILSQKLKRKGH